MAISANDKINEWLSRLDSALKNRDSKAAAELFAAESYWRDFVTFTWNLKTLEGRAEISSMLEATLGPALRPDEVCRHLIQISSAIVDFGQPEVKAALIGNTAQRTRVSAIEL